MDIHDVMKERGAKDPIYLGDSVYAGRTDEGGVWLVTWNGFYDDPRNKIYLEPQTLQAFDLWRRFRAIDAQAVLDAIGYRAMAGKSGESKLQGGAVKVRVVSRQKNNSAKKEKE